jgi:hypothetical protein
MTRLSGILVALVVVQLCEAGEWRGIVPLRSTRADVEKLLGKPSAAEPNTHATEGERVTVTYAERPCDHDWQVPPGTVLSIAVHPQQPYSLASLKLVESRYEKRRDVHIETLYYYVNAEEGINYTVDRAKGVVLDAEFYPPSTDSSHRCTARREKSAASSSARPGSALSTAERMKAVERLAPTYEYSCVMHPQVRQVQDGTCPKCGMPLTTVQPSILGDYQVVLATSPQIPKAGKKTRLQFAIFHPHTGARVKDYVVNHEKLFHLFLVSQDMTVYQHLHPQLQRNGTFTVDAVLPKEGPYKLHGDFFPAGGTLQLVHRDLSTAGSHVQAPAVLTPDSTFSKTVDGMTITLEWDRVGTARAGVLLPLPYRITDERTGEPVRDLEPYLGAWGHTLILNADQSESLHSHPTETVPPNAGRATVRGGPVVTFQTLFPAPGLYRIWTQFQRRGRVSTVAFTVRIPS